jgi:DNA polymerase-3 subunit gamma/tau
MWPEVLEQLGGASPRLAAALREAHPASLDGSDLTLAWPAASALSRRQAEDPEKRELVAQTIRAVTGVALRVAHEVGAAQATPASAPPPLSDDELVERFMAEFDAEELPPEAPPTTQES